MVNTTELKKLIKDKGLTYTYVGKQIGVTYMGMRKKMDNVSCFKADEIFIICELLELDTLERMKEIFFTKDVA